MLRRNSKPKKPSYQLAKYLKTLSTSAPTPSARVEIFVWNEPGWSKGRIYRGFFKANFGRSYLLKFAVNATRILALVMLEPGLGGIIKFASDALRPGSGPGFALLIPIPRQGKPKHFRSRLA